MFTIRPLTEDERAREMANGVQPRDAVNMRAVIRDGHVYGYAPTQADAERAVDSVTNVNATSREFFRDRAPVIRLVPNVDKTGFQAEAPSPRHGVVLRADENPADANQQYRRTQMLMDFVESIGVRMSVGPTVNVLMLSYDEYVPLYKEFTDAWHKNDWQDHPFQPVSLYAAKVTKPQRGYPNGIRQLLVNEVGTLTLRGKGTKIVVLKDQGPGDMGEKYVQVPVKFGDTHVKILDGALWVPDGTVSGEG